MSGSNSVTVTIVGEGIVGDVVTENALEGTDTVQSGITYLLGANVENLTLTSVAAVNGTGNTLNNVLQGNNANNTLDGGQGDDTLHGYGGTDTLVGGLGNDAFGIYDSVDVIIENLNEGIDSVWLWTAGAFTLAANVENLTLGAATATNGTGNALNNSLTGNASINVLDGQAGADILIGGAGSDTLIGGAGADRFDYNAITEGNDTITDFTRGAGGDVVDIRDVLVGYLPGTSNAASFVQLFESGTSTTLRVNADGVGTDFVDLAVLQGNTALLLNDMLAQGNLVM